ncbi:hypothetical protein [Fervidibacillus halotolerans]|uniref:SCP2 domain-containing protein n=1 Tax=Fervidibacillus halotolerans TaxID=2980027 RepID=A0A9E8RXL8_9BACI|nr:hypothetical protein [Fervidibacillus halotolerans]WAA11911.1 hypothetical protein OE105_09990 [Fervidibacillus halotolerans]
MDGSRLVATLKAYPYAEILFPKEPLLVQLVVDGQSFFLSIRQGEILFQEEGTMESEIILSGTKAVMEEVIEGKRKLLEAIRLKGLQAKGSYRRLLLLESIFWLAGMQ